jgi:hypothetical protein
MRTRPPSEDLFFLKYSLEISFSGKKPWRSAPKSTNAASKLGSTRVILPL